MKDDRYSGRYVDVDTCPENPISWRFFPKRKNGKIGVSDAVKELFDSGMCGNFYVQIIKVPSEFPVDHDDIIELMEPEDACRILAQLCHYKLFDSNGKELV